MSLIIRDIIHYRNEYINERNRNSCHEELSKRVLPLVKISLRFLITALTFTIIQLGMSKIPSRKFIASLVISGFFNLSTKRISRVFSGSSLQAVALILIWEGFKRVFAKSFLSIPLLLIGWQVLECGYEFQEIDKSRARFLDKKFLTFSKNISNLFVTSLGYSRL